MIFSNPNIQRTHDSFYKNNKATDLPKDSFIMVADLIEEYESGQNLIEIADIGSAAGNFARGAAQALHRLFKSVRAIPHVRIGRRRRQGRRRSREEKSW